MAIRPVIETVSEQHAARNKDLDSCRVFLEYAKIDRVEESLLFQVAG